MRAIDAVPRAVDALKRNPLALYVVGIGVAVGGGLVSVASHLPVPLVNLLFALFVGVVWLFVEPFLAGGYLGMIDESFDGETSYETLTSAGREHYTDLLVARVVVLGARFAFGLAVAAVLIASLVVLLGVALSADTAADPGAGTGALAGSTIPVVLAVVVGSAWLVQAAVGLFVQFYAAAIVLDGEDAVGAFARSYRAVRGDLTSAVAYSAIVWVVGVATGLPIATVALLREFRPELFQLTTVETPAEVVLMPTGTELLAFLVATLILLALRTVATPPRRTYYVAFYRALTD